MNFKVHGIKNFLDWAGDEAPLWVSFLVFGTIYFLVIFMSILIIVWTIIFPVVFVPIILLVLALFYLRIWGMYNKTNVSKNCRQGLDLSE